MQALKHSTLKVNSGDPAFYNGGATQFFKDFYILEFFWSFWDFFYGLSKYFQPLPRPNNSVVRWFPLPGSPLKVNRKTVTQYATKKHKKDNYSMSNKKHRGKSRWEIKKKNNSKIKSELELGMEINKSFITIV